MTFQYKGIRFKIGFLFFAVLAILMCGGVNTILQISVISGVLHELGHLIALLCLGDKPQQITFGCFGISVVRRNDIALNYKSEIITAFCGPLVNFILCVLFRCVYYFSANLLYLNVIAVNVFLGTFNLIPIFGLDGGRILENALLLSHAPDQVERIVRLVSLCCIIPLMTIGFCIFFKSGYNFTLCMLSFYLLFLLFIRCK